MNLIPFVKGAEEAFSIGCLHELRGTIESITDELVAGILCNWALVSASKTLEQAICLNECLCKVNAVKFQILRSSNGDDGPSGCTTRCGAESVIVVDVLLHFEALYNQAGTCSELVHACRESNPDNLCA